MIPRVKPEGMLFRKPVPTFRDHALAVPRESSPIGLRAPEIAARELATPFTFDLRIVGLQEPLILELQDPKPAREALVFFLYPFQFIAVRHQGSGIKI
jgi:hypothetical protein